MKLFHSTKHSTVSIDGVIYHFGNIGSYVRTTNSIGEVIVCEVVSVLDYIKVPDNETYNQYNLDSSRELVIKPIGTIDKDKSFHIGIGIFPSLYEDVDILTVDNLDLILSTVNSDTEQGGVHHSIEVGYSKNLINYRISLNINRLFNIHTAILGNSGSGKSHTVASILQKILRFEGYEAKGAKVVLFDVNGEYSNALCNQFASNIGVILYKPNIKQKNNDDNERDKNCKNPSPFVLPYYLMNLEEWLAFLMASDRTQKPFWDKVLQETFKFHKIFSSEEDTQKKYEDYFKWKICNILNLALSKVDSDTSVITGCKAAILKCNEIIRSFNSNKELDEFLKKALESCGIKYGENNGKLVAFIKDTLSRIDENIVVDIDSQKLRFGEYFDFKFLKVACELVFLEEEARGNERIREYTSTMLTRLDYFLDNPDCDFMRTDLKFNNVDEYLNNIFYVTGEEKQQLIIIDSSEVDNDILELMTSVVSRMLYEYRRRQVGDLRRKNPIHIVLDEAHRYIHRETQYILKQNVFERIAREGRKFSLYLIVSSHRPSELSSTVLSQCANFIIHRIQNEVDLKLLLSDKTNNNI